MPDEGTEQTALTEKEMELVKQIAQRDGITVDEAATRLFAAGMARPREEANRPRAREGLRDAPTMNALPRVESCGMTRDVNVTH